MLDELWDQRRGDRAPGERGASLVEFAMVVGLVLILLFGLLELARLGYAFSEVWTAAREGARYAITTGDSDSNGVPNYVDCDAIKDAALSKVFVESLTAADVTVEYVPLSGTAPDCQSGPDPTTTGNIGEGTQVEVTVTASFDAVVPLLEPFFEGIILDNSQIRTLNYGVVGGSP